MSCFGGRQFCDGRSRSFIEGDGINPMQMFKQMRSAAAGVAWPAIPDDGAATMLAMQFQMEQSQWWSAAKLQQQQLTQLRAVLRHARETVPFWRQRWQTAGIDVENIGSLDDFRRLQVLRRDDVLAAGEGLISTAVPKEHGAISRGASSGSTGTPVIYAGTGVTAFFWRAFTLREHFWHRRDFSGKLAAIRLKVEAGESADWGPATAGVISTGPCALLNLRTDLDEQLAWLQRQAPQYLLTNATNLRWIAAIAREKGLRLPGLLQARSFGGPIDDGIRETVREAWNVEVVDLYTSEEVGYIALQCPQSTSYHIQSENLIVEILDTAGNPCAPGEVGRVVLSTLHNFAMPLIRYEIGDYAEAGEPCACGRGLPVIRRILGRERNMLRLPDGRRFWPSFPASRWSSVAPISRLQLVQKTLDDMLVRIVAPRDLTGGETGQLIEILQDSLGYPFRVTIERVPEMARSGNYKFEDFISECAG